MANRPGRAARIAEVTRVEQLTPHMGRIVVGGAGFTKGGGGGGGAPGLFGSMS